MNPRMASALLSTRKRFWAVASNSPVMNSTANSQRSLAAGSMSAGSMGRMVRLIAVPVRPNEPDAQAAKGHGNRSKERPEPGKPLRVGQLHRIDDITERAETRYRAGAPNDRDEGRHQDAEFRGDLHGRSGPPCAIIAADRYYQTHVKTLLPLCLDERR